MQLVAALSVTSWQPVRRSDSAGVFFIADQSKASNFSFDFNAHTIIPLERSFKLEFAMAADEVDQVDGVLLSWDLDLLGDSSLVITTRDECKQVGGCQSIKGIYC